VVQPGDDVLLHCPVNVPECGVYHSLKWYRDSSRVYVYSPVAGFSNAEGALMDRCLDLSQADLGSDCPRGKLDASEANVELLISPLAHKDEGEYRCEITYLEVSNDCPVIHSTNVRTIAPPEYAQLSLSADEGEEVTDKVVGPYAAGSQVSFTCTTGGGKPAADVTWYWEGLHPEHEGETEYSGEEEVVEEEDGSSTVYSRLNVDLEREHTGAYLTCSVENEAVDEPLTARVQVDVNVAVESLSIQEETLIGVDGEQMTVSCVAQRSRPPATIIWNLPDTEGDFLHDKFLDSAEEVDQVLLEDETYETVSRITFPAVAEENGMTVSCEATNEVMSEPILAEGNLNIHYLPRVEVNPSNLTLIQGEELQIGCIIDANPANLLKVEWLHNGEVLEVKDGVEDESEEVEEEIDVNSEEDIKVSVSENGTLLIQDVYPVQTGEYTCHATNLVGEGSSASPAFVEVLYPPRVEIGLSSESLSEEDGFNVTMSCSLVDGNPEVLDSVSWYLDGNLIQICGEGEMFPDQALEEGEFSLNAEEHEIKNEASVSEQFVLLRPEAQCYDDNMGSLLVDMVDRRSQGEWGCMGSNEAGVGPLSPTQNLDVQYLPGEPEIFVNVELPLKGESLVISCETSNLGNPQANNFIWNKNGEELPGENSINLTLASLGLEDEGNYSCQAVNDVGAGDLALFQLDVHAPPSFLEDLSEETRFLSSDPEIYLECKVECIVSGDICSIEWVVADEVVSEDDIRFTVEEESHTEDFPSNTFESVSSRLSWNLEQFPDQKLDHSDHNFTVRCRVEEFSEGAWSIESSTNFIAEYPPESVELSESFLEVEEGESAPPLLCTGEGVPEPSVSWKFNGEEVSDQSVLEFADPIQRSQSGDYFCHVANKHGEEIINITIEVFYKPTCSIDYTLEKENLTLTCTAEANPEDVTFWRWTKEGNVSFEGQTSTKSPMKSVVELKMINETLGTYYCHVNNSIGEGEPCQIHISEDFMTRGLTEDQLIIIIAVVAAILVIVLIVSIIACIKCCKRNNTGKDPNSKNETPQKSVDKQGYEKLPFHGLKNPPKQVLNPSSDDMDYADADYKDVYAQGPLGYKAASQKQSDLKKSDAKRL